jgi:uncharacterized 2Fe-2S/4Fe-4S cluster protein (DUF4445 family)
MEVNDDRLFRVIFEPSGNRSNTYPGTSVLKAALHSGNTIRTECGGNGKCGKCRVIIKDQANISKLTIHEKRHLASNEVDEGYRLACQSLIYGSTVVFVPQESRVELRKIQVTGYERPIELEPAIRKIYVSLPPATLMDPKPDLERLLDQIENKHGLNLEANEAILKSLPAILRKSNWDITATIWNEETLIAIEPGDTTNRQYGISIDIGTSKIVSYAVDLLTGETLGTGSVENPQIIFGEDLLTRISSTTGDEAKVSSLQNYVVVGINEALTTSLNEAKVSREEVYEATVVGNTVMHHLLLGLEPRYLATSPFTPVVKRGLIVKASDLGLNINPNALVDLPPLVAGFIGSDALADTIATGLNEAVEPKLLLDIGTNTEIFLGDKENIVSCSCASGPAFEGGHIKHGLKAVTGAIEKVKIDSTTLKTNYKTIGKEKPRGLCGSAMVDIVAELWRNGLIDSTGRLQPRPGSTSFRYTNGKNEFIIVHSADSAINNDIVVTQNDINEIQRAKAAIFAGYSILLKKLNLVDSDLKGVYIAGAFGGNLDPLNAETIGLLPKVQVKRIRLVGNTAITGAKMALVSRKARSAFDETSNRIGYIELSAEPLFMNEYASALFIPHKNAKRFES